MLLLKAIFDRLVHTVILVVAVIVFNFGLIHLAPGGPIQAIVGEMGGVTPQILAQLRHAYGLDKTLPQQLWIYLSRVLRGDLGVSYYFNKPVTSLIAERLPATLLLVITALILAIVVGTLLGIIAARRPNGIGSHIITIFSLAGYSAPIFWTGLLAILLFAAVVPIFPVGGMRSVTAIGFSPLDVARHLVLPALTLAIVYLAQYSRLARASMLEVLTADYVRTARAKGLPEWVVIYKHALRNAVLPVVTVGGLQFSQVLAGAVLTETVFNWPGMGRLAYDSILRRDTPTILGILIFSSIVVIVVNILTDLAYRLIDPRIGTSA
ncbi:MAG: ABC transporter permease [Acetobacteraceae bacterium]